MITTTFKRYKSKYSIRENLVKRFLYFYLFTHSLGNQIVWWICYLLIILIAFATPTWLKIEALKPRCLGEIQYFLWGLTITFCVSVGWWAVLWKSHEKNASLLPFAAFTLLWAYLCLCMYGHACLWEIFKGIKKNDSYTKRGVSTSVDKSIHQEKKQHTIPPWNLITKGHVGE